MAYLQVYLSIDILDFFHLSNELFEAYTWLPLDAIVPFYHLHEVMGIYMVGSMLVTFC